MRDIHLFLEAKDKMERLEEEYSDTEQDMKYTLEEIEAAFKDAFTPLDSAMADECINLAIENLTTPKPEFKEGQVVYVPEYGEYRLIGYIQKCVSKTTPRPLTLQEAGPDFVLRKDVEPLMQFFKKIEANVMDNRTMSHGWLGDLIANTWDDLPDYLRGDDD